MRFLKKIIKKHPKVKEIQICINDFRKIYADKNLTLLNEFIEKNKKSKIKSIAGFAGGLIKDKKAIENSVISQYNNGFVEGNNNRLKMLKDKCMGEQNYHY